ncbi:hypothetical protein EDO6_04457 [Paenibacillus xylanexedens]|nr:hypothetical protein EDO6_04457 [Paenibacillus xylanexedens]
MITCSVWIILYIIYDKPQGIKELRQFDQSPIRFPKSPVTADNSFCIDDNF